METKMETKLASIEPVVKTVTVACTPEEAFRYFTADFGVWWPLATHSVVANASEFKDKPATVTLEPHVSGRIFERTRAGEEHLWGNVLAWQPPGRVVFSFHPGRDAKEAQTGEVPFSPAPEGARVVLTHSGWERLSANAKQTRDRYNQGWGGVFVTAYPEYLQSKKKSQEW